MAVSSITEPTCTHEGYIVRTCSVCNEQSNETISPISHQDINQDGLCDVCGVYLDKPSTPGDQGDVCKYCGKVHSGPMGGILKFFHNIAYFFAHLFGKK